MPMFDLTALRQVFSRILPCPLCSSSMQMHHGSCQDCWEQLPWHRQTVERQTLQIHVACQYRYPVDRIIQQFKYEQQLQHQQLLSAALRTLKLPRVQAIVPMPISRERLIERGYNQSLLLAKTLARELNVPVWQPVLRQAQHAQKGLSRLERLDQIEAQFEPILTERRRYRRVLMLDDVVTTGSSLSTLAQALTRLGCQQITAVCVAAAATD